MTGIYTYMYMYITLVYNNRVLQSYMYMYIIHLHRSEVEIEEDMFKPLYDGAGISVCGAYCAIMEFKCACRLPFTAVSMLLQLLQLHCPADKKLPRSVYVWKKFFQRHSSKHTKLKYCCHCNQQISSGDKKCSGADCQEVTQDPNTLIVLRPDKAIRRIFLREYTKFIID